MSKIDLGKVPGVVKVWNKGSKGRTVSMSGYSQQLVLQANEVAYLKAINSSELIGYLSQSDDDLVIVIPEEVSPAGMPAVTYDYSGSPCDISIVNNSGTDRLVNISGYNQSFILTKDNEVVLKAENSSELIGYFSQGVNGLDVTVVTTGSGDTPPEGGDTPPEGGDTPPEGGDTPPEGGGE